MATPHWSNRRSIAVIFTAVAFSMILIHLVFTNPTESFVQRVGAGRKAHLLGKYAARLTPGSRAQSPIRQPFDRIHSLSTSKDRPVDPCQDIELPHGGDIVPKNVTNTKVLITGGGGFIGSNLVDRLLELGYTVRILDNLYTGFLRNVPLDKEGVEFILGDILDPAVLAKAVDGIDYVYHLAAMSKVVPSLKDPAMARFCVETNALGTWNVLNATRAVIEDKDGKGVKKVVYAASSTYYGNVPPPHREDLAPDFITPYAASKYEGELQMQMFDRLFNVPTISTRFFMVYGPRQPSTGAYAIVTGVFAKQAAEGKDLTIEGDGSHYRDFIHVDDIVKGMILAQQGPNIHGDVVNLGSGKAYSVQDVANLVSEKQTHVDARKNDLEGTLADTCRMKKLLGYRTTKEFKHEMAYMVKETLAGNVFMQSWLTSGHTLAAPHLLAPGTPVLAWPSAHDDLGLLLQSLEAIKVDGRLNETPRRISVVPFTVKDDDDEHLARSVLLNTIFSLVRFAGVLRYIVATNSAASLKTCLSLNLPCYDIAQSTYLELFSNLLDKEYDVHVAQVGNSYMRSAAAFMDGLVEKGFSDIYHAKSGGDVFIRNNKGAKDSISAWIKDNKDKDTAKIKDIFTVAEWPSTLRSNIAVSSFDVSRTCNGFSMGLGATIHRRDMSISSRKVGADACVNGGLYVGVSCAENAPSLHGTITSLKKVNLWHLHDCMDLQHCDIQQLVPRLWVQKMPDLTVTAPLCK